MVQVRKLCVALLLFVPLLAGAGAPPKLRLAEVQDAVPVRYRAELSLDPSKADFTGTIQIALQVQKPVQTLWLNAHQIKVLEATITAGGKPMTATVVAGGEDYLGFQFPAQIPSGQAEIKISYQGVIRKDSSGVFHSEESGNQYIFTQFESTDARSAFPCFDEPLYKVPWQLTITHPTADAVINNSPVAQESKSGTLTTTVFKETKPLPSYLVAFAVGPFEFVPAGFAGKNKAPIRIVTPKGRASEAKYAAEVTATILTRLEDYFGVPFPYEKSDQVAVPAFVGGAMENAGMVTYGQDLILANPATDTIRRQRGYAEVAAHELAHQWFGDLVTTSWWNDIWLNEGFATWMEQKLISEWKPEWNTRLGDTASKIGAQTQDSLVSARQVRQPIESKGDIANAFDGITYEKGAAMIGMFEKWMGADNFRRGVLSYMKQYAFRTTTSGDFLDSLTSAGKKDVTKAFSTFLNQAGVPNVAVSLDCSKSTPVVHLEQTRFLPLGSKGSATAQTWSIPICIRYGTTGKGTSQCTLMSEAKMDLPLAAAAACPVWVQANDQAKGYYRMEYKDGLLAKLTEGNVAERLTGQERVDLMGNAKAMADAGKISTADALLLAERFHDDPEREVLDRALNLALSPRRNLVAENLLPNYQRFLTRNFGAKAKELGWVPKAGESDEIKLLRPPVVRAMASYGGDMDLAKQAQALALAWLSDRKAVAPDVAGSVLRVAGYYGDKELYQRFLTEFVTSKDRQDQQRLLAALTDFRDPAALAIGYQAVIDQKIPLQQGVELFFGTGDTATAALPFRFVKAHFEEIVKDHPVVFGFELASMLPFVGGGFCDPQMRTEFDSFFAPLSGKFDGAPRNLAQVEEGIDLCIAIKQAQQPRIAEFLSKY